MVVQRASEILLAERKQMSNDFLLKTIKEILTALDNAEEAKQAAINFIDRQRQIIVNSNYDYENDQDDEWHLDWNAKNPY